MASDSDDFPAIPGATVDRDSFLMSQLQSYCNEEQVQQAIESRPVCAGISDAVIEKLAASCIRGHIIKASGVSFATGLPGGWAMAGTIPADIAQFYWHALVLCQKLAYLYGWPDLLVHGEVDEETEQKFTLLIGAMMGAGLAQQGLVNLSNRFAAQVGNRLPRQALTKHSSYNLTKQVGRWIGVRITKSHSLVDCRR